MGDTAISWTDKTWNPIRGCSRVSAGCQRCYAEIVAARFGGPGQPYEGLAKKIGGEARWTGEVRFIEEHLTDPLRWRKPQRIFVNSMSDLFHEQVEGEWLDRIFAVMALAPQHTFQVLTKRPERMREYLARTARSVAPLERVAREMGYTFKFTGLDGKEYGLLPWPIPNVHLGVSVENQATADERIPILLQTPAAVRWISAEPLLGPVDDLCRYLDYPIFLPPEPPGRLTALDWVVVGGESGPGHRPMQIEWLESIVNQCRAEGVPVWVKQDSGPKPGKQGRIPDHLWIQEPAHA